MYEDISRERKEKDRIRRRAYVRMVTNLGGSLNLELFCDKVGFLGEGVDQVVLKETLLGTENLLQLPHAGPAGQVRRLRLSSADTWVHGEPFKSRVCCGLIKFFY